MPREDQDPYAPPARHKERSGGVVRFAVIAALLGAAAWGYMEYADQPQTALVQPGAEETTVADNSYDTGYSPAAPMPSAATPTGEAPQSTTPAEVPETAPADPPA